MYSRRRRSLSELLSRVYCNDCETEYTDENDPPPVNCGACGSEDIVVVPLQEIANPREKWDDDGVDYDHPRDAKDWRD